MNRTWRTARPRHARARRSADAALALPWLLMTAIVVVDVLLPVWMILAPALAAVPALAAAVGRRPGYPLQVGAATLAASFINACRNHDVLADTHLATLIGITLTSFIGWAIALSRARRQAELAQVRTTADVAQRVLLRPVPAHLGPVGIAVDYTAAAANACIGGDLYDVRMTRWGLRALIGDVRGKGLPAVATAAAVLGAFREAAHDERQLTGVVHRIAVALDRDLPAGTEEFVTLAVIGLTGTVRAGASCAEVVNCGHPAPLLLRPGRAPLALVPPETVPPLGVLRPADVRPPLLRHLVQEGDSLLLYTDGITEARDAEGEFYPLARRLTALDAGAGEPADVLQRLHTDVRAYAGHAPDDDAAALCLRYEGGALSS